MATNPNQFNSVLVQSPKRNQFNLSQEKKLTAQIGRLTPVACYEVVPGDTFSMQTNARIRLQALLSPLMHRVDVYFHNFYVPNRLVWDKWEDFITQDPENPSISFPRLKFPAGSYLSSSRHMLQNGSNADYFGLPTVSVSSERIDFAKDFEFNALPFRAFTKIYNDYYRDENLQDELNVYESQSGVVTYDSVQNNGAASTQIKTLLSPLFRAWEKDYFTSALPDTQLGGQMTLPIRGLLEVGAFNSDRSEILANSHLYFKGLASADADEYKYDAVHAKIDDNGYASLVDKTVITNGVTLQSNMGVDLANSVAVTINELRETVALQSWLERSFVGGTRYKESILAHYGVLVPDGRLQRPEYLGGGKQNIVVSPVVQQSAATDDSPLGQMAGYGISEGTSNRWKAYFPEHGYVITIMSIMPKPSYQNMLSKMWTKDHVLDFYFPEFAHLGEEEILNREVWFDYTQEEPADSNLKSDAVFGYAPRYATYKFSFNEIHGEFKDSMDYWTLTRKFANQPTLSEQFIRCNGTEMNNPFATKISSQQAYPFIVHLYHDVRAWRPMPVFATPKLIG